MNSSKVASGWPDSKDQAYRRKTQARIKARLKKLSGTVEDDDEKKATLEWLLLELGQPASGKEDDQCERAATFLTQFREEILPQLIGMHRRLCDLEQKENALTLGAVIDMVTPLQFTPDLWRKVREQIAARRPLVRGAAAGIVTAETVATRIDASEKPGSVKLTKGSAGGLTSPHLMLSTSFKPDVGPLGNPGSELEGFVRALRRHSQRYQLGLRSHGGSTTRRIQNTQGNPRPFPLRPGVDAREAGGSRSLVTRAG